MVGGALLAKNCGHCAKLVGSGVSSAALSSWGNRAQEGLERTALARERVSATPKRTRPSPENM